MNKIKHIFLGIVCSGLTLLLCSCKGPLLDPKGLIAADEKHLIILCVSLMLLVVIPVIILAFVFSWKYRASNPNAKYRPDWNHSTLLEVIWWGIPIIIIGILGFITWVSTHRLDPYKELAVKDKPVLIEVIALDWKWLFIYPEQNIATVNYIQFPVNVPVRFHITAEGAMNSFQIPQLGSQIYAMAGMKTQLNLIADTVGDYKGMSTNFSGEGFSDMKFTARASSQDEFNQWVAHVKQSPEVLTAGVYSQLAKPSENNAVEYFSSTEKGLFDNIVMKAMMPMDNKTMKSSQTVTNESEK